MNDKREEPQEIFDRLKLENPDLPPLMIFALLCIEIDRQERVRIELN